MRSMDDYVLAPHSRYTEVRRKGGYPAKHPELDHRWPNLEEAGSLSGARRQAGKPDLSCRATRQYDRMTLNNEYHQGL